MLGFKNSFQSLKIASVDARFLMKEFSTILARVSKVFSFINMGNFQNEYGVANICRWNILFSNSNFNSFSNYK